MKKKVAKVCFENLVNLCSKTNWNKDKLLLKAYNEIQSRVSSTKNVKISASNWKLKIYLLLQNN